MPTGGAASGILETGVWGGWTIRIKINRKKKIRGKHEAGGLGKIVPPIGKDRVVVAHDDTADGALCRLDGRVLSGDRGR